MKGILRQGVLWVLLAFALPAGASGTTLVVTLQNVKVGGGALRVGVYREPATFRKEDKALAVVTAPADAVRVELSIPGLAPGPYAIMAYHDENADGVLNRRFGMFPTEGYGLSNNPRVAGPPAFEDSAFDVNGAETRVTIDLRY